MTYVPGGLADDGEHLVRGYAPAWSAARAQPRPLAVPLHA